MARLKADIRVSRALKAGESAIAGGLWDPPGQPVKGKVWGLPIVPGSTQLVRLDITNPSNVFKPFVWTGSTLAYRHQKKNVHVLIPRLEVNLYYDSGIYWLQMTQWQRHAGRNRVRSVFGAAKTLYFDLHDTSGNLLRTVTLKFEISKRAGDVPRTSGPSEMAWKTPTPATVFERTTYISARIPAKTILMFPIGT